MWEWGHPEAPPAPKGGLQGPWVTGCGWHCPPPRGGPGGSMELEHFCLYQLSPLSLQPWVHPLGWDPHAWGQLGGLDPHVLSVTSHVHVSPGSLSPGCWPYKQLIWGSLQPQTPVLMGGTPREGPQCPSEVSGAAAVGGTGMAQRWHVAPQRRGGDRERPDVPWAGARGVLPVPSRCWQGQPHIPMAGSRGGTHRWVPHTCPRCHRPRSPPLAAPGASGVSQNSPSGAIKAGRARGGVRKTAPWWALE